MSLYDCKTPFAVLICLSAAVGTTGPLAAQASRVIRCGSASGGQVQCQTHGKAENVRLVRDLNRDRCRQGESWGFTDSFIWTNNGCWADFEVVYRGPQGLGRNARIITCGTTSGLQVQCETHGFATAVRLRRDLSGSRCSQPSSWGYTNALVWVSKGCRAEFEVTYGAEPSPLPTPAPAPAPAPAPGKRVVSCASQGDKMTFCKTDGTVTAARLLRDRSGGRCGGPGTWGYAGVSIWVKLGCQGDFEVTLGGPP